MKLSLEERGPIAGWLIRSRARFSVPGADHTWNVDEFLPALRAATGWSPARTTYARWESGAVRPSPKNLSRVEAFYAGLGVPSLEEAPKPEPAPDMASALNALVAELRTWREEDRVRIADLEATVARLAEGRLSAPETEGSPVRSVPRRKAE